MKRCLLAKAVKTLIKSNLDPCRATITCRVKLQKGIMSEHQTKYRWLGILLQWFMFVLIPGYFSFCPPTSQINFIDCLYCWLSPVLSRTTQYSTLRSILWLFDSRLPTTASWLQQLRSGRYQNILSQLVVCLVCATHSQVDIFWQIFVLTLSLLIEICVVHFHTVCTGSYAV